MTTSISTSNPAAAGVPRPVGASGAPGESQLRSVPAAAAGASGASPTALSAPPAGGSAETGYYFLDSVQTTSPQVLPLLNIAPPGAEPPLGFTVPTTAGGADPRGLPGRTAVPGQHLGSTAPATPGVELGAQPFVPAVPPASAFGSPNESLLRSAPAAAAGVSKSSTLPLVQAPGVAETLPYFLTPEGAVPAHAVPPGSLYFVDEARRVGETTPAQGPEQAAITPELVAVPARP